MLYNQTINGMGDVGVHYLHPALEFVESMYYMIVTPPRLLRLCVGCYLHLGC